ncbi:MAG: FxsA family protein, partial [Candidatus Puniceispirillaceae bacterium]
SLLLGGFLMLLPGYVTDAIGILCFVPGLRFIIGTALLSRLHIASIQNMFGSRFTGGFSGTAEEGFDKRGYPSRRRKRWMEISSKAILKKKINNSLSKTALGCRMLAANP